MQNDNTGVLAVMKEAAEDVVSGDVGLRLLRAAEAVACLIAEYDAAARDAARYRWLRQRHDLTHQDWHVRDPFNNPPDIGGLDAAIDAALEAARAPGGGHAQR